MVEEIKIVSLSGRGSIFMKSREYFGYWLDRQNTTWGQVEGQHQTYGYLNQVGESIVSTTVRPRPLSITGWVVAGGGQIQDRCDRLNAFISPVEDYTLEVKGKKINFRPDCSIVYSREYMKNNEKVRRFLIQGTCPYPLFTDLEDTVVPFDKTGKMFHFPTDWGREKPLVFAVTGKAYNVTVNNRGGFSTGFIVRVQFSGEVRNPKIWNMTTGKFIGVNRAFSRGEQMEICTISGSKRMTLRDEFGKAVDLIKYRDYRSSFDTQLQPGANLIAIDCEDPDQRNSMDVTLYYTPLHLEVE